MAFQYKAKQNIPCSICNKDIQRVELRKVDLGQHSHLWHYIKKPVVDGPWLLVA